MSIFSKRLRDLRAEKHLSSQVVAEALGITRSAYTNYELAIREPSFAILVKLCDFFGVTADYLLGRSDY